MISLEGRQFLVMLIQRGKLEREEENSCAFFFCLPRPSTVRLLNLFIYIHCIYLWGLGGGYSYLSIYGFCLPQFIMLKFI